MINLIMVNGNVNVYLRFSGDDTDRSNAAGLPLMPQLLTSSLVIVTFFNNNDERAYYV